MLNFLVQPRRCARSAVRLLRRLLKRQGFAPKRITTDKLKSYAVALHTMQLSATHDQRLRTNNARRTPTSQSEDAGGNCNASSRRDQHNGSCRSTPPSTTPSMSSAIFCLAGSSRSFALRHSVCGIGAGLPPDPDHARTFLTAALNVSKPNHQLLVNMLVTAMSIASGAEFPDQLPALDSWVKDAL